MIHDFKKLAALALSAVEDKKGVHPVLFDLRHVSDIADYMLIVSAESSTQMRAIDEHVEDVLEAHGARLLRRDGLPGARWCALDYGGLVLHILTPEARAFFRLEQMWEEAKVVGKVMERKKRKKNG